MIEKKSPDIIYGHQCFMNEDAKIIKVNTSIKYKKRYIQNHLYIPPSSGLCFRSSVIKKQLFDINHHYNMDTEWFLRYPGKLSSGVIPTPTCGFRVWQGSKTYSLTSKYSPQAEEDNISEEIIKEREILDKKYYAPYRKSLLKKYSICSKLIPKLVKVEYLINKVFMKINYLVIKLIKGI